ncbi:MAG: ABC transporter permease [Bdellovibrionaceae bacterium]|nr:ABC transporter permease [Pseudobdellovibrionaceae bacterium]
MDKAPTSAQDFIRGGVRIWQRNFQHFLKSWPYSILLITAEPLVILGAIGYGLGSFVNNINGQAYVDFFFPGLVAFFAMIITFFEGTYGSHQRLIDQKLLYTVTLTRIEVEDVIGGEILWAMTKGLISVSVLSLVGWSFDLGEPRMVLLAPLFSLPTIFCFACVALLFTGIIRKQENFLFINALVIIPMGFLSGTFFPQESLPFGLQILMWVLPLAHGIQFIRDAMFAELSLFDIFHVFFLISSGLVAGFYAVRFFKRRNFNS